MKAMDNTFDPNLQAVWIAQCGAENFSTNIVAGSEGNILIFAVFRVVVGLGR